MEFVFALKQNVGAPSVAVVSEGELVKRGQLLAAKPAGALGTYLYSSIDGKVKSLTENEIIIEELNTDFDQYIPLKKTPPVNSSTKPVSWVSAVQDFLSL